MFVLLYKIFRINRPDYLPELFPRFTPNDSLGSERQNSLSHLIAPTPDQIYLKHRMHVSGTLFLLAYVHLPTLRAYELSKRRLEDLSRA